jgi:filamentous hemagglutinin
VPYQNQAGTLSGSVTTVSAASVDNTGGKIEGDALAVSATGNLVNHGGTLTQYGTGNQTISAGGVLDNTAGTIASNADSLNLSGASIDNDNGTVQHAGAGALNLSATGGLSNAGGKVLSNGSVTAHAASLDNTGGTVSAQHTTQIDATSGLVNHDGSVYGVDGLSLTTQGDLDNTGGSAQSAGNVTVSAGGALDNAGGTLTANGAHSTARMSRQRASTIRRAC